MNYRAKITALLLLLVIGGSANWTPAHEATEWTTTYSYSANDTHYPRVLLIGDSIVKGYQDQVRLKLAGVADVSFYATSKSVTDPFYQKELLPLLQQYKFTVIQFNNGLHSLHDDPVKWEAALRDTLAFLAANGGGAQIVWATSTPLKDPELEKNVEQLNAIAARVVGEQKLPVDDLFARMNPLDRATYWVDTFHYNAAGWQMLADEVSGDMTRLLGKTAPSADEAKAALATGASDTGPDGKIAGVPGAVTAATTNAPAGEATGAGQLGNASFAKPGLPWRFYPPDNTAGTVEFGQEGPTAGSTAVKVSATKAGLQLYQPSPIDGTDGTYTIHFMARAEDGGQVAVFIRTVAPPYVFSGVETPILIGPVWQEYQASIPLAAGYNKAACSFFFQFPAAGTCYLSNVRVEKN